MHIHLSIALTLLAVTAGMFLLAKTKTENPGKLFRAAAYAVILIASLSLLCQVWTGVCRMACCTSNWQQSENCRPASGGHHEGMHNCYEMKHGSMYGNCCKGGEGMSGCMEDGEEDEEAENHHMESDSAKTK